MTGTEQLEDGWGPSTPDDDTLLRQYVLAFADRVEHDAVAMGQPCETIDAGVMANPNVGFALGNSVALTRPVRAEEWPALVTDLMRFYGTAGFAIWSAWPTPDLRPTGLVLGGHPPFMIRPVAPRTTLRPAALEVERVSDAAGVQTFVETLEACYPLPGIGGHAPGSWIDERVLRDDYYLFIGRVAGKPVATAAASCTRGVDMVEFISLDPEMRGRGLGEAITWEATMARPDLPSVLIASDDGRPAYVRMGYATVSRFTLWIGPGRDG